MHVRDLFHECRFQSKRIVSGIEDADSGPVGKFACVDPTGPGFGATFAQLPRNFLGKDLADGFERHEPQADKINQLEGIKGLGDSEAQMFPERKSVKFPRFCAVRKGELHHLDFL